MKRVVEYDMYISTHVSVFSVCIVFFFCYMLLSKEEIKKEVSTYMGELIDTFKNSVCKSR